MPEHWIKIPPQLALRILNRHPWRKARAKEVQSAVLRPRDLLLDLLLPGHLQNVGKFPSLNHPHLQILHPCHRKSSNNQTDFKDRKHQPQHKARPRIPDLPTIDTPHPVPEKEHHFHTKHRTTGIKAPLTQGKSQKAVGYKWFLVRPEAGQSWQRKIPHYPRTPNSSKLLKGQQECLAS